MENMEIKSINEHFRYYLENESQFKSSERFVYISKKCKNAYSFVYSNLLLNICSDFESLVRAYFGKENDDPMEVHDIIQSILSDEKLKVILTESAIYENCDYETLHPLKINHNDKTNKDSFKWWEAYNKIKHNKVAKIFHANQENIINALAALYILNRYVLSINADNNGGIDIFGDDNNCFKLNQLKSKSVSMTRMVAVTED